ncbi:MAG TPA: hypothetical protein VEA69_01450 [Tepidisphaeraceae bacterium]|nr:hypothetical protein [Tepidisphaeraceae bacterium]
MARQTVEQDTPDTNERIAAVLEQLAANAPVQEIGYGHPKFQERLRAEGFFDEFAKPVYQNGLKAEARGLKPETIERAPKLRAGRYLGGKVEVVTDARGGVHLRYANSKVQDRMRFQQLVRDFDDLIDRIWNEMQVA